MFIVFLMELGGFLMELGGFLMELGGLTNAADQGKHEWLG